MKKNDRTSEMIPRGAEATLILIREIIREASLFTIALRLAGGVLIKAPPAGCTGPLHKKRGAVNWDRPEEASNGSLRPIRSSVQSHRYPLQLTATFDLKRDLFFALDRRHYPKVVLTIGYRRSVYAVNNVSRLKACFCGRAIPLHLLNCYTRL